MHSTTIQSEYQLLTDLEVLLRALRARAQVLRASGAVTVRGAGRGEAAHGEPADEPLNDLEALEQFIQRLTQITEWLRQDPQLEQSLDHYLTGQLQGAERVRAKREFHVTTVTTVVGALLGAVFGWLFSSFASPSATVHQLLLLLSVWLK